MAIIVVSMAVMIAIAMDECRNIGLNYVTMCGKQMSQDGQAYPL